MNFEKIFVSVPTSAEERKRWLENRRTEMSREEAAEMIQEAKADYPAISIKKGRLSKYVSCYLKGLDDAFHYLEDDITDYIGRHPELTYSVLNSKIIEDLLHNNSSTWKDMRAAVAERIAVIAREPYEGNMDFLHKVFEELIDLIREIDLQKNLAVFGKIADIQTRYLKQYPNGALSLTGEWPEDGFSWENTAGIVYSGVIKQIHKYGIGKEQIKKLDLERDFLLDEMRRMKEIVTDEDISCILRRFHQKHPIKADEDLQEAHND